MQKFTLTVCLGSVQRTLHDCDLEDPKVLQVLGLATEVTVSVQRGPEADRAFEELVLRKTGWPVRFVNR